MAASIHLEVKLTKRANDAAVARDAYSVSLKAARDSPIPAQGDYVTLALGADTVSMLVIRREFEYLPEITVVHLLLDLPA